MSDHDVNVFPILLALIFFAPALSFAEEAISANRSARYAVVPQSPNDLQQLLAFSTERLPLLSAHRGGPESHLSENSIATFENTLQHTFAMMEIDPRMTRDGKVVVHHDATLERTTNGSGQVASKTLQELKQLRLKDREGNETEQTIPTLDETIEWARGKTILVRDQKDVSVEARVRKIEEHAAEAFAMLIVYSFKDAQACYALNSNIMMEVMIPNQAKFHEFDRTGVPWKNVIAFVGHTPPEDRELLQLIHQKGTLCMAGTSRNLDKQLAKVQTADAEELTNEYRRSLDNGVDVIETDVPCELGPLLFRELPIPESKSGYLIKQ